MSFHNTQLYFLQLYETAPLLHESTNPRRPPIPECLRLVILVCNCCFHTCPNKPHCSSMRYALFRQNQYCLALQEWMKILCFLLFPRSALFSHEPPLVFHLKLLRYWVFSGPNGNLISPCNHHRHYYSYYWSQNSVGLMLIACYICLGLLNTVRWVS